MKQFVRIIGVITLLVLSFIGARANASAKVYLYESTKTILVRADLYIYGTFATPSTALKISSEINQMWNAPKAQVKLNGSVYTVKFNVRTFVMPVFAAESTMKMNKDELKNYIRVENYSDDEDHSFISRLGSNTGFFITTDNLGASTTVAHEFGHSLGLDHPSDTDYRKQGIPGIMFPRGTLVDPRYQYDPKAKAAEKGSTMNPKFRLVKSDEILSIGFEKLQWSYLKSALDKVAVAKIGHVDNKFYSGTMPIEYNPSVFQAGSIIY